MIIELQYKSHLSFDYFGLIFVDFRAVCIHGTTLCDSKMLNATINQILIFRYNLCYILITADFYGYRADFELFIA